jgi:hypothetical protein
VTDYTHSWPTLLDTVQMFGKDGKLMPCAETLTRENEWLDFMPWVEASDWNVHAYNSMTGLPTTYIKKANRGVVPSLGTEARQMDPLAVLTSLSQIHDEVLKQSPNPEAARYRHDKKHMIALGNEHGRYLIYGDPGNQSGEVLGLTQRYNDPAAGNSDNLLTCGGTGADNTSIWLLAVSPDTIACPYARGSMGGLEVEDLGRQLVPTSAITSAGPPEQLVAWTTEFNLRHGLAVMDWRYASRACNLSLSELKFQSGGQNLDSPTHIFRVMSRMQDRIPGSGAGTQMFYLAGRGALSYLKLHAMDKSQNVLSVQDGLNQFGMPRQEVRFQGIRVLRADALNIDEALVAGVTL